MNQLEILIANVYRKAFITGFVVGGGFIFIAFFVGLMF